MCRVGRNPGILDFEVVGDVVVHVEGGGVRGVGGAIVVVCGVFVRFIGVVRVICVLCVFGVVFVGGVVRVLIFINVFD